MSFADIMQQMDHDRDRKISAKLPHWAHIPDLDVPTRLAMEQCSSTRTALFKARLLEKTLNRSFSVADITGGLGVDSWAFAQVAQRVWYFERDEALAQAAARNFERLELPRIVCTCTGITSDSPLPNCDVIYADPARRSATGRKVFRLEDCTPDILSLLPHCWKHAARMLIKLSPMADISLVAGQLGPQLEEVHVVGFNGECKELLCLLGREHRGGYTVHVDDLDSGGTLKFTPQEERDAEAPGTDPQPGRLLFVPSAVLMKAGCFKLLAARFGVSRLSAGSNLYVTDRMPEALRKFGSVHRIQEIHPFGKSGARLLGQRIPAADVTARGLPLDSGAFARMMGVRKGNPDLHIFGVSAPGGRFMLVTTPLRQQIPPQRKADSPHSD